MVFETKDFDFLSQKPYRPLMLSLFSTDLERAFPTLFTILCIT